MLNKVNVLCNLARCILFVAATAKVPIRIPVGMKKTTKLGTQKLVSSYTLYRVVAEIGANFTKFHISTMPQNDLKMLMTIFRYWLKFRYTRISSLK